MAALAGVLGLTALAKEAGGQSANKKNKNKKARLTTNRVSRNVDLRSGDRNVQVNVNCKSKDIAISGGWEFQNASDTEHAFVAVSRPANNSNSRTWVFVFHKPSTNRSVRLTAYAICAPKKS